MKTEIIRRFGCADVNSANFGMPFMVPYVMCLFGRQCEGSDCTNEARRRYCSETCRRRSSRQRERRGELVEVEITATISIDSSSAFGVSCSRDVADIFALDRDRFRHWGMRKWPRESDA